MRKLWRNNGLSIVLFAMFAFTMIGQALAGHRVHNEEQREHHQPEVGLGEYLRSGHFWEATGENWESEFLQMAMYIVLTVFLFQKGSSESKDPNKAPGEDPVDADPRLSRHNPDAPGPVKAGGWRLWLYSNSLAITFLLLFLASFLIHAVGGLREHNEDQRVHGSPEMTLLGYLGSSRFWFESFQNWQSEFLSLVAMVVLSIFLRQWGSPESKPVAAPHSQTGHDEAPEQEPPTGPVAKPSLAQPLLPVG